ncbi:MAG: DUF72 domain-containing protein [Actinomycetota bacterium]
MTGDLYVGTSGFAYPEWKGVFYPEGVTNKKMLEYYSSVLGSVEINYTFRRMPAETTLMTWKSEAASSFRFTLKAPQRITHFKRLKDVGEDVDEFVRRARLLGDQLGTILFQLPPNMKYERERLAGFLAALSPVCRFAMEFRNATFNDDEVFDLLHENDVAYCGADTDEVALDAIPVTAKHVYMRLRREEYDAKALKQWGTKVSALLKKGTDVYCYFKHEDGSTGPRYAQTLQKSAI